MKTYFFSKQNEINDATFYYVDLIEHSLKECGYEMIRTRCLKDAKDADVIVTIASRDHIRVKLRYPFKKSIFWSQGVGPEEVFRWTFMGIRMWLQELIMMFIALHTATLLFLVSDRMLERYRNQYLYLGKNFIIMPCYNMHISKEVILEKYNSPTFVYAGGYVAWQCVSEMLQVYSIVEKSLPNAKLTLLTNNKQQFEEAVERYGFKNYEIKYVPKEQLDYEMKKHKYGFLLRHDTIVNNVATPTKMNSYLSNYIIPIFTDAVNDFKHNIQLGEYTLCFKCPFNINEVAEKIIAFEKRNVDFSSYPEMVQKVFENHYNDEKYIVKIHKMFAYYDICK